MKATKSLISAIETFAPINNDKSSEAVDDYKNIVVAEKLQSIPSIVLLEIVSKINNLIQMIISGIFEVKNFQSKTVTTQV